MRAVLKFVAEKISPPSVEEESAYSLPTDFMVRLYLLFSSEMLELTRVESSGIPLLGCSLSTISKVLNTIANASPYQVVMEFPVVKTASSGKNPSTDAAVVATIKNGYPVLLCEYKPVVNLIPERIVSGDFIEMLVQVYYCMKSYSLRTCPHCLTDLQVWHYYKFSKCADMLKIEWVKSFKYENFVPTQMELKEHFDFVIDAVKI